MLKIFVACLLFASVALLSIYGVPDWNDTTNAPAPRPDRSELPDRQSHANGSRPDMGPLAKKPKPPAKPEQKPEYPKEQVKKGVIHILFIGSDGRSEYSGKCSLKGARADSLHIVSINTKTGRGTILNIPRDSYVYIPGVGTRKINEALYWGGPDLVEKTVEQLTGFTVKYWIATTFCDLIDVVNRMIGIRVDVPYTLKDKHAIFWPRCSRAHYDKNYKRVVGVYDSKKHRVRGLTAGRNKLINGCEALYFSRVRYGVPGGDFGRTANQAEVLRSILQRVQERSKTPWGMWRTLKILRQEVTSNLRCEKSRMLSWIGVKFCKNYLALANLARKVRASSLENKTLSGYSAMRGSASVVVLSSSNNDSNDAFFRDIRSDAVLNGK